MLFIKIRNKSKDKDKQEETSIKTYTNTYTWILYDIIKRNFIKNFIVTVTVTKQQQQTKKKQQNQPKQKLENENNNNTDFPVQNTTTTTREKLYNNKKQPTISIMSSNWIRIFHNPIFQKNENHNFHLVLNRARKTGGEEKIWNTNVPFMQNEKEMKLLAGCLDEWMVSFFTDIPRKFHFAFCPMIHHKSLLKK